MQALVPEYIPRVPGPRLALAADAFRYRVHDGNASLSYIVFPPFGRRIYRFQTGVWDVTD